MPIQCPACGAANADHSWQCACGHYFVTTMPKVAAEPPPGDQGPTQLTSSLPPQTFRLWFRGDGSTLFGIYIVNLLLTLLTVGIYYFWGKVKVRQYLYGQTEFEGDRCGYHGTGKELLIGWLKAFVILGLLVGFYFAIQAVAPGAAELLSNLLSVFFYMVLIPVAIVGSRRYRLSRTSWRGTSSRGRSRICIAPSSRSSRPSARSRTTRSASRTPTRSIPRCSTGSTPTGPRW